MSTSVIKLDNIGFERDSKSILRGVHWHVQSGQHWAVIGPNGSGKTSLLKIATGYEWPSRGGVQALGRQFGRVDLRQLRRKMGWCSAALAGMIRPSQAAWQIVVSGAYASTALFDSPTPAQRRRAAKLLDSLRAAELIERPFGLLSLGEQQKVLIARALMPRPRLLILDEPCAGLDITTRENVLETVGVLCRMDRGPSVVLVSHHIEEILPVFTHVLAMKDGQVFATGTKEQVLRSAILSKVYGLPRKVTRQHSRYWPRVTHAHI